MASENNKFKLELFNRHWQNMPIQQQFETALGIIKNLPKDGPYQPSNEIMLKFYGYYKQATVGPCNDIKPNFWDVIRRAKWEAWHKLGIMGEEEAMTRYVDELKQIIETMSFSSDVAAFMETLGPFYESIEEEENESSPADSGIELEAGNINALLGNFDESMVQDSTNVNTKVHTLKASTGNEMHIKAQILESRVDKMMQEMDNVQKMMHMPSDQDLGMPRGIPRTPSFPDTFSLDPSDDDDQYEDPSGDFDIESLKTASVAIPNRQESTEVNKALRTAIQELNCDMDNVKTRLSTLETQLQNERDSLPQKYPPTILGELSGPTTAFVIVWPFLAFALLKVCNK